MNRDREQVFLSYAAEDRDEVRKIAEGLEKRGLKVWFDEKNLRPGRWKPQILRAINQSRYFVFCLSENALRKTSDERPGFVDEELQYAYQIAMAQPEAEFTIVAARLQDCGRGDTRLSPYQQYDLFPDLEAGLDKLAPGLGGRSLADSRARGERTKEEKLIGNLMGKAQLAYYVNQYETAIALCNTILEELKPGYPEAWYNKGVALWKLGRHEEALRAWEEALRLKPDDPEVWNNKGVALDELGRREEALCAYDEALRLKPDFPEALHNRRVAASSSGSSGRLG